MSGERGSGADIGREERTDKVVRVGLKLKDLRRRKNKTSGSKEWPNVENGGADEANSHSECDCGGQACNGEDFGEGNHIGALDPEEIEAVKGGVPGTASVWVKTFGCSHNASDSEVRTLERRRGQGGGAGRVCLNGLGGSARVMGRDLSFLTTLSSSKPFHFDGSTWQDSSRRTGTASWTTQRTLICGS